MQGRRAEGCAGPVSYSPAAAGGEAKSCAAGRTDCEGIQSRSAGGRERLWTARTRTRRSWILAGPPWTGAPFATSGRCESKKYVKNPDFCVMFERKFFVGNNILKQIYFRSNNKKGSVPYSMLLSTFKSKCLKNTRCAFVLLSMHMNHSSLILLNISIFFFITEISPLF